MLVLAFDTSTSAVTVAVVSVEEPVPPPGIKAGESFATFRPGPVTLAARDEIATNRHGELLAPAIEEVLAEAGATPRDLSAIGVGLGPGPFTGLRVGIVTAKSMGDALGIPVYGECSLDVIAHELSGSAYDHDEDVEYSYVVMSDARRKQVYWATYNFAGGRETEPEISLPAELADDLSGRIRYVGGAGALLYRDVFQGFDIIERSPYPSASSLAQMVHGRLLRKKVGDDLTPLYLRRPDAQPPGVPKKVTPA